MTTMPPACASAIAIRLSVTVSIAEDRSGMFIRIRRVTYVVTSAVDGNTFEAAGTRRTSSKVRASRICMAVILAITSFGSFHFHAADDLSRADMRNIVLRSIAAAAKELQQRHGDATVPQSNVTSFLCYN